ncbi:MAG: tetratricopeptide repeat protein [Pirellulales bacterium]
MRWNGVRESRTNVQGRNWLRSVLVAGSFGASGLTGLVGVASPAIVVAQEANPAAKPESSPEATALYADAASFQNNGAFDLAVDEWSKFLEKFPKDPLAPKAQHYLGVCQLQLKQFDKAVATFTSLMKDHPKFELLEDATFNLALSHYSQASATNPQSYATAAKSLAAHLQKFPKSKHADQALFFQGESLYNQGEKKEAIAAYESVVKNYPESKVRADAAYAWGVTLEELQQYPQAGVAYDLFLKSYSDNGLANEVRMRKAETVLQAGQFADAEKQFAAVAKVEGFAQADHASLRRAFCLVKQDKFPEAAAAYAEVAKNYPQSPALHEAELSAGRWYYRVEQYPEASMWLAKAAAGRGPEAPEAAHWLARIALRSGKPAEALAAVDAVLPSAEKSSFFVALRMDRADALYEIPDKRAESLKLYREIATSSAEHELAPQALYNLAFGELDAREYDAAVKDAQAFLDKYKEHRLTGDVEYVRAESQLLANKLDEADKNYQALVERHGSHRDAGLWRVRWALTQFLAKKYDVVVKTLAKIEGLAPPELLAEAHYLVGASQYYTEKYAAAIDAFNASLKSAPKWRQADETLLLLSRCQAKLDQTDAAKATIRKLLTDLPESKLLDQAHYRLGEYAYSGDDFTGAIAAYDVVTSKYPESTFAPYAWYGKGWSLSRTKQFPQAVAAFTSLLEKWPQHALQADSQYGRGLARRQAGDVKGAVADLDAYLASNPPVEAKSNARYERGLAQVAAQDFAGAVATFDALLKENEKYADADKVRYELAWAYKSQEKNDEAVAQFRTLATAHPSSPLAGEAHFHVGEGLYDQKKFDEAVKEYAAAKQKAQPGEIAEKAAYKLGWSHFHLKQFQPALDQFTGLLEAYPKGMLAPDGTFMVAECYFRLNKYKEALPAFKATAAVEGLNETLRSLGLLHGGQAASQLSQWKDSVELLDQLIEKFPKSSYLYEALYERGWAKQNLKQIDEALVDYEAASAGRDQAAARARFMIGEIRFDQKKYDEAVKDFQRVMFGFGGEKAPTEVKTWQAKSGFEAARCWEVRIEGAADAAQKAAALANARRFYSYVVEKHPQDSLAADAKKRLDALK